MSARGVGVGTAEPGVDTLMLLADEYATASEEVISEQHSHPGDSYKNLHPARNKARADLKAAIQRALGVNASDDAQPKGGA